jgi:hypothetical protein
VSTPADVARETQIDTAIWAAAAAAGADPGPLVDSLSFRRSLAGAEPGQPDFMPRVQAAVLAAMAPPPAPPAAPPEAPEAPAAAEVPAGMTDEQVAGLSGGELLAAIERGDLESVGFVPPRSGRGPRPGPESERRLTNDELLHRRGRRAELTADYQGDITDAEVLDARPAVVAAWQAQGRLAHLGTPPRSHGRRR